VRVETIEEQPELGVIVGAVPLAIGDGSGQLTRLPRPHQNIQAGGIQGLLQALADLAVEAAREVAAAGIPKRHQGAGVS
jgi:hypothetical protein